MVGGADPVPDGSFCALPPPPEPRFEPRLRPRGCTMAGQAGRQTMLGWDEKVEDTQMPPAEVIRIQIVGTGEVRRFRVLFGYVSG